MALAIFHGSFEESVAAMDDEAQGIWSMALYLTANLPEAQENARAGDADAATVLSMFHEFAGSIKAATLGSYRKCFACWDTEFTHAPSTWPASLVLFHPDVPNPTRGMIEGLCTDCTYGIPRTVLQQRLCLAFSKIMDRDGRVLPAPSAIAHG